MDELITKTYAYYDEDLTTIENDDTDRIRSLLLGHKVEKVADDHLELDDGTMIRVVGNDGCGGCASGHYHLTDLNAVDNIITSVEFVENPDSAYNAVEDGYYEVFVVAEDKKIRLMRVDGTDGNGYYGTGYRLIVRG